MKESHRKDPASHPDPESCVDDRKVAGEALTGAHAGQPSSCEITVLRGADAVNRGGRPHRRRRSWRAAFGPRAVEDPEHAWKLLAREPGDPSNIRRDDGEADRPERSCRTSGMHVRGKSDDPIVPKKRANNDRVLGRSRRSRWREGDRPRETPIQRATPRTQSRTRVSSSLISVRLAARRDRRARFTALLHHVTLDRLRESFYALKRNAAAGVDGVTWQQYEVELEIG